MPLRVKICGVTRLEDALRAAELGADAIGFNFWPGSKRRIAPEEARAIALRLPPFVAPVGVFVDQEPREIREIARVAALAVVQLHGDEEPAICPLMPLPVIKAIRVGRAEDLAALSRWGEAAAVLLDAPGPSYGGTGGSFDWELARAAPRDRPIILAGGLTPENVAQAVGVVRPWAVDVASGVESSPGVKDADKLARFLRAAKGGSSEPTTGG